MEALNTLVSESLARHGFDRPPDYRRLQWSRWFRCESHHSLLFVPSKPGVFAIAEEITDLGVPKIRISATASGGSKPEASVEERRFSAASGARRDGAALAAESLRLVDEENRVASIRRILAVTQFFEDDDMAFVLDRMLSYQNPLRARLNSGRYFVRFVVIESQSQRRSLCSALNQWIANSTEKVTGIGSHFASSLEFTEPSTTQMTMDYVAAGASPVPPKRSQAVQADQAQSNENTVSPTTTPQPDSGAATNIHCPFPSGF